MIVTTKPCMVCGKRSEVEITEEQHRQLAYEHVQVVFPDWTPDQRELLITGTHGDCWDSMFSEDEK